MIRLKTLKIIFVFMFLQTVLAVAGGLLVSHLAAGNSVPHGLAVAGIKLGGMDRYDAERAIFDAFDNAIKDGSFTVLFDDGQKFEVKYSDIDARIDYDATINHAMRSGVKNSILSLTAGITGSSVKDMSLIMKLNEGKLRSILNEISHKVNRESVDAHLYIQNDTIVKEPEKGGIELNILNAVSRIKKDLGKCINSFMEFKISDNYELKVLNPDIELEDYQDIDIVLSKVSVETGTEESEKSIIDAVKAVNSSGVFEPFINGKDVREFSFNEQLGKMGAVKENLDEGYNRFVSTLYEALLKAGIDSLAITRRPNDVAVDYAEPGLDACVKGEQYDFRFYNTLSGNVMVLCEVIDETLTIRILGSEKDKRDSIEVATEVVQKFDPPVINVVNNDLMPGEQMLMTPGVAGLEVNVYIDGKVIDTVKYEAIMAVVEIGPNTGWVDSIDK